MMRNRPYDPKRGLILGMILYLLAWAIVAGSVVFAISYTAYELIVQPLLHHIRWVP